MNKTEKFWDKLAKDIDLQSDQLDQVNPEITSKIEKYLKNSDTILDYGCARGGIGLYFASKVKKVHGIDISSKMITIAKKRAKGHKIKNAHFDHGLISDAKYPPGSFDVILVLNVMHLVPEYDIVLTQLKELLKPGGIIIFETPCLGNIKNVLSLIMIPLLVLIVKLKIIPPINFFKTEKYKEIIIDKGFKIIDIHNKKELLAIPQFLVAKKV